MKDIIVPLNWGYNRDRNKRYYIFTLILLTIVIQVHIWLIFSTLIKFIV